MNTSKPALGEPIEQKATIQAFQGKGQVVRDGFFLPLEVGMELQAGDRVSAQPGGRVEVQFTGVNTALVVANGSSVTLFVEMTDPSAGPQWVAGNLYGPAVFFAENNTASESQATAPAAELSQPGSSSMMGLFGYDQPGSGAFPMMETVAGASALALVAGGYSGTADEDSTLTTASQAGFPDSPSGEASGNAAGSTSGSTGGNTTDTTAGTGDTANGNPDGGAGSATGDTPLDALLGSVNGSPLGSALSSLSSPLGLDTLLGQQTLA